ncbi:MAG: IS630 family transposase, partial [Ignavibacteriaceae bacterium]
MTEIEQLNKLIKGKNTAQKIVLRAKIILGYKEGKKKIIIAEQANTSRPTVDLWIQRYEEYGISGILKDASRPGRKPKIDEEKEKQIVEATLNTKPRVETHWSTRTLAEKQDVSKMTIQRIWKKYNLKPHLVKRFKISNDPQFMEKVTDVVGLYLNPPDKAIVFCVDEKSQIQALDRTQPSLPMKKGQKGTMTHDYKRHGTTSLFAALNTLEGKVIGECYSKHTHKEFIKFLNLIDKQTSKDKDLHLILDNYGTHKTEPVKQWLKKHPRFNFHFIPTSSSWLNMVERFFGVITEKRIRRGVFTSVKELETAIKDFLIEHNEKPKIFKWTKDADTIMAKV